MGERRSARVAAGPDSQSWLRTNLAAVPATGSGLDLLGVTLVVAFRWISVLQLVMALLTGSLQHAISPTVNAAAAGLFIAQAVLVTVVMGRRRTPVVPWLAWVDAGLMCLLMLSQLAYSPPETRFSTWDAWGYGVSMSTALLIGFGLRPGRQALVALASVAVSYVASVAPSAHAIGQTVTVYANAIGYLFNGCLAWWIWGYLLRLGIRADLATELAAQAERERAESERRVLESRHQAVAFSLHDSDGQLSWLIHELTNSANPTLRAAVEQLQGSVRSSRTLLAGDVIAASTTLGGVLQGVSRSFPSLEVTCHSDQVDGLVLDGDLLKAVEHATRTLLTNVQRHAGTNRAVVHGALDAGRWEVTVADEGVGMDQATVREGYGLRTQVREALGQHGVDVDVSSGPGLGTLITISGATREE